MNSITTQDFGKLIRKINKELGTEKSHFNESRIRGWGSSTSGIDYTYPTFRWRYQLNWRYLYQYEKNESDTMDVKFYLRSDNERHSVNALARFPEVFRNIVPSEVYDEVANNMGDKVFRVRITNPYYGKNL